MNSIQLPVAPINVSIRDFLTGIFGADLPNAWVCVTPEADSPDWAGCSASKAQLDGPGWATQNCYYSVAVLKSGATSRQDVNWSHTRVLVVDDVVEKASADSVRACLGEPSFIVQTSPGSQQWGYILDKPITDGNVQRRLMRAITLALFKGIEPGHRDLTRYVRLPAGVNNKATRVSANGGTAPGVVCLRWEPTLTYAWQDLAQALDAEDSALNPGTSAWEDAEGTRVLASSSSVAGGGGAYRDALMSEVDYWIGEGDYILDAFVSLGWLVGEDNNGYYKVRCPWGMRGLHSNTDDRTGWSPQRFLGLGLAKREKGFSCFHSDGSLDPNGRADHEVMDELRLALDAEDATNNTSGTYDRVRTKGQQTQARNVFAVAPLSAGMVAVQTALATATAAAAKTPFTPDMHEIGQAPLAPIELRPEICSLVTRGEVTVIAAAPGGKKSLLSLTLALNIASDPATDPHERMGEETPFDWTGDVIIVSNEDAYNDTMGRRNAWVRRNNVDPNGMARRVFINKVHGVKAVHMNNAGVPAVTPTLEGYGKAIEKIRVAGGDVCLFILDTAASVLAGIEENDNVAMHQAYEALAIWGKTHNVGVLVLHHLTKDAARNGVVDLTSLRGAGAVGGSIRTAAILQPLSATAAKRMKPEERKKWVSLTFVKASHGSYVGRQTWFKVEAQEVEVVDPRAPVRTFPPLTWAYPTLVYDAEGPRFGPDTDDDDRVFRSLEAIMSKLDAGEVVRAGATGDGIKGRDVIAEAIDAESKEGGEMQKALVARGLLEEVEEPVPGRGERTRTVLQPTAEGRALVKKRQDAAKSLDVGIEAPVSEEPGAVSEEPVKGILEGLGEINF